MTCGNWLGYASENRDFVTYFMSGYFSSAANNNVLDYNRLQRNSRKVASLLREEETPHATNGHSEKRQLINSSGALAG